MKFGRLLCLVMVLLLSSLAVADLVDFEENRLASESYFGGAGSGETGFTSGDAYFIHNDNSYSWDGFLYSNQTDITTAGYTNQFSAYATGSQGNQYGIGCVPLDWSSSNFDLIPQTVSFGAVSGNDYASTISGLWITNTTYAYLSMSNGDSFAKKFGGETGDDADWFKLIIKGIDELGNYTGTIDFYLADFRFTDNQQDYIIDDWTWVDTASLGDIVGLEFSVASSDVGDCGINTPTYFAVDNINGSASNPPIPEPATMILLSLGSIVLRKRK